MPITFAQVKKRQQFLIIIMVLAFIAAFGVLYFGILKKEAPVSILPPGIKVPKLVKEIPEINFEFFKREDFKSLEIISFPEEPIPTPGRENPFLPY